MRVIEEKRSGPTTERIHQLRFCVLAPSAKFHHAERDFIKTLTGGVSCIVVLTQCLGEDDERAVALSAWVARAVADDDLDVFEARAFRTLAQQLKFGPYIVEAFGLDELVEVSYRALPEAVKPQPRLGFRCRPEPRVAPLKVRPRPLT